MQKIQQLSNTLEEYRSLCKKEISKACEASYANYKKVKKITLDDNYNVVSRNVNDVTQKTKKQIDEEGSTIKYIKYNMVFAQDATRK